MASLRREFAKELADLRAQEQDLEAAIMDLDQRVSLLESQRPLRIGGFVEYKLGLAGHELDNKSNFDALDVGLGGIYEDRYGNSGRVTLRFKDSPIVSSILGREVGEEPYVEDQPGDRGKTVTTTSGWRRRWYAREFGANRYFRLGRQYQSYGFWEFWWITSGGRRRAYA